MSGVCHFLCMICSCCPVQPLIHVLTTTLTFKSMASRAQTQLSSSLQRVCYQRNPLPWLYVVSILAGGCLHGSVAQVSNLAKSSKAGRPERLLYESNISGYASSAFTLDLHKKSATLPSPPWQNIGEMAADNYPLLSWAINTSLPPKSAFGSWYMHYAQGARAPVLSVRKMEVQTSSKLPIPGIPGLCSGILRIPFSLLLLTEREMLFFSSQSPRKLVAKGHVTLPGMLFHFKCCLRHLPCWWPDSKSYV